MRIAVAADHAGFAYKEILIKDMLLRGYEVSDLGGFDENPSDYPDHAADVAQEIINGKAERGVLICGSGVGVSVAANKFKGIRAGVCHDSYSAHQSVEHDDANVLCLGERIVGIELATEIVFCFLQAVFSHEIRHEQRLAKILLIEEENMK